ncbi:MAG TPA: UDP-4-amino-4,6-dideoxy-N-acetyl-beta-L-altrosamine transaminase [Candidatus Sulfotelmatobacter sp.]|nr:UDP-4-amino-4,6-dideoxy-N-acetyl-beta-L-altrosamine transaminase [Candidatus Sulfotelmatobacter sp.]
MMLDALEVAQGSRYLGYGRQLIGDDDVAAVVEVLRSDFLTRGPAVERFEAALAERVGARFCVAVSSGTAALHLACLAAGLKPGAVGLTTPLTFVASANAMVYCGADVALADIDHEALGLSPHAASAALGAHPEIELVMPVHYAGLAHAMGALRRISGPRIIVEDACHALGGAYEDGRPVGCGAYSEMAVFSFHPVKPITTAEGGAIVTNQPELARLLRLLRSHGIEHAPDRLSDVEAAFEADAVRPWYYEQQLLGFNYRMSDLQAALGLSQLGKLEVFNARRRAIAERYDAMFVALPHVAIPQSGAGDRARSALHLYVLRIDFGKLCTSRKRFMERLASQGVGSQVHYVPVHHHPFHRGRAVAADRGFPVADRYYAECLSLPLHQGMSDDDVERVIYAVTTAIGEAC